MDTETLVEACLPFKFSCEGIEYLGMIWYETYGYPSRGNYKFKCWTVGELKKFKFLWWNFEYYDHTPIGECFLADEEYDSIFTYIGNNLFFYAKPLQELTIKLFRRVQSDILFKKEQEEKLSKALIVHEI